MITVSRSIHYGASKSTQHASVHHRSAIQRGSCGQFLGEASVHLMGVVSMVLAFILGLLDSPHASAVIFIMVKIDQRNKLIFL